MVRGAHGGKCFDGKYVVSPPELFDLPNVVLTPHIGSATFTARHGMTRLVVDNLLAAAQGRPLVTPVEPR